MRTPAVVLAVVAGALCVPTNPDLWSDLLIGSITLMLAALVLSNMARPLPGLAALARFGVAFLRMTAVVAALRWAVAEPGILEIGLLTSTVMFAIGVAAVLRSRERMDPEPWMIASLGAAAIGTLTLQSVFAPSLGQFAQRAHWVLFSVGGAYAAMTVQDWAIRVKTCDYASAPLFEAGQRRMKNFIAVLTTGDLSQTIGRYSDMILAALVVIIIGMLIIPLPTPLLDVLLVLNMSIAVLLLLLAIYVPNALQIASFPSLLLITTLFRLALNVSSTRLILLTASAGDVIAAFGDFVVQGNLVVGIVIFLILTIINFLVITKGAERVAEVAARFTLDAMPGKQMSIDADLRAGAFDMDEARRRRNDLGRESQLFGSMDGAMKFVKGDSIAGLIITAINIVAGIIIGSTMLNMSAGEALQVFAILTIGDGLVSQIPALLIAICAGLIVTRVASEESEAHLGKDIALQLLAQPRAWIIASTLMVMLGLVPGLPMIPFWVLSAFSGAIGYGLVRSKRLKAEGRLMPIDDDLPASDEQVKEQRDKRIQTQKMQEGQSQQMLPVVTPIALEVAGDLIPLVEDTGEGSKFLGEMVPMMRDGLFYELGVRFPGIRVRGNETDMPAGSYLIMINEIPLVMGTVSLDKVLVNDTAERLRLLNIEGETATNPANGNECAWIDAEYKEVAEQAGLTTWDAAGYIVLHLSSVLRKNAAEFVGIQEVMNMLEQLEQAFPALVKETVPKVVSPFQLTDILRRLVEEEISIRDLRSILQSLAEWGQVEHDTVMLTEYVRSALKRYISHKYTRGQNTLIVYLLDPQIEETVRSSIQHTSSGSYLALEPEITQEILSAVRTEVGSLPPTAQNPVILTTMEIRRYFRKLVELEFPHLAVLSYQELSPDMNIQPIARISLE